MATQPIISEFSRQSKLRALLRQLPAPARILEVGTGDGWFAAQLRAAGHDVVTLDIAVEADVQGCILSWRDLGFEPGSFDVVVAMEVIEHVDCLRELIELTRPGGLVFLSSPHPRWDWLLRLMEGAGLLQRRTSPHVNLTDFASIPLPSVLLRRPMLIHQVGLFRVVERAV